MRRSLLPGFLLAFVVLGCQSPPPRAADAPPASALPLRNLRLYENGVGYFERQGTLGEGGAGVAVPASHVDDALKSLVILSSGSAKVSAIEFPSVVSDGAARSLAGLPLGDERPVDFAHVLASLEGFRVSLTGTRGEIVRGRLLDVEQLEASKDSKQGTQANFQLLVVAEDGALVRTRASDVVKIQPLDPEFSARLQTAADALGDRAAQLSRNLRVLAQSSTPVRIGYIAETPVWRSSYRLVLPGDGANAALQGFALVHNDTDEPWQNVAVELVNGTPDSFLYPLAAPRYMRRDLHAPSEELSTVPQLALRTPDAIWGDHVEESYGAGGIGLSGVGEGGGGTGMGVGRARAPSMRVGRTTSAGTQSSLIEIGDLAAVAKAAPKDEGRLFSYRLAEPVSLRAHGSALLPFIGSAVTARRLTRFQRDGVARAVVRFQNDSPYILPAGPLAIFERTGFAGETVIDRLVPGDRAFISYGVDLDVVAKDTVGDVSRTTERIVWSASGALEEHYVQVTEHRLSLSNHGGSARTIAWSLRDVVRNAKVEGADELDFDDAGKEPLALFAVPERKSLERKLRVTEGKVDRHSVSDFSRDFVERLANAPKLPPRERAVFRAALPQIVAMEAAGERTAQIQTRRDEIDSDLERNREHLQAAQGANAAPIAARIVELEKALEASRTELQRAEKREAEVEKQAIAAFKELQETGPAGRAN